MFSPDRLVIQIEDNSIIHPVAQKMIYRYKKQGYKLAIRDFEFSPRYFSIMDAVDYVKVNFGRVGNGLLSESSLKNVVDIAHSFGKQVVAYQVNSPAARDLAQELSCEFTQGTCVAEQTASKVHRVDHMQSNFFQLMVAVARDEPDVEEITQIISRDVALAFSLMKLVNSAYFALRNRAKSIQQALVILGIGQLKQWIYLLSFKQESGGTSEELIKTSFLRATFCQELAKHIESLPISSAEAYMLGMFSTLDQLMELPLDMVLAELPVAQEIKEALLTKEGKCGYLYQLVLCYESADWGQMTHYAELLGLPMNIITQIYFDSVESVNAIWSTLLKPGQAETEQAAEALEQEMSSK